MQRSPPKKRQRRCKCGRSATRGNDIARSLLPRRGRGISPNRTTSALAGKEGAGRKGRQPRPPCISHQPTPPQSTTRPFSQSPLRRNAASVCCQTRQRLDPPHQHPRAPAPPPTPHRNAMPVSSRGLSEAKPTDHTHKTHRTAQRCRSAAATTQHQPSTPLASTRCPLRPVGS